MAHIVASERSRRFAREAIEPTAKTELQAGDVLLIDWGASDPDIQSLCERFALEEIPLRGAYFADRSQEIGLAEVIVAATSDLVGRTIVDGEFRTRFKRSLGRWPSFLQWGAGGVISSTDAVALDPSVAVRRRHLPFAASAKGKNIVASHAASPCPFFCGSRPAKRAEKAYDTGD